MDKRFKTIQPPGTEPTEINEPFVPEPVLHTVGDVITDKSEHDRFTDALARFIAAISKRAADYEGEHYPSTVAHSGFSKFQTEWGKKYIRVIHASGSSRSAYCFVRIADGAILKAEGWKKPAKHVRGSIFVNDGLDGTGLWGANYLR